MKRVCWLGLGVFLVGLVSTVHSQEITVRIGEHKSITVPRIREVICSDEIDALYETGSTRIMISGLRPGPASLTIYTMDGRTITKNIYVHSRKPEQIRKELSELLKDVTGLQFKKAGERVIVEGTIYSAPDKVRFDKVIVLYPDVINMVEIKAEELLIEISTQILEVSRDKLLDLKLPPPSAVVSMMGEADLPGKVAWTLSANTSINPIIEELIKSGAAQVIANPTVVTMNKAEAKVISGGEIGYPVVSANGAASVEWKEYGVRLTVTPELLASGQILMDIDAEASEPGTKPRDGPPPITKRQAKVKVAVKQGTSVVIGGLYHKFKSTSGGFGCIGPFIAFQQQEKELVIVVTPQYPAAVQKSDYPSLKGMKGRK
jgi:Flp pilus assembly secretin CpaC